MHATHCFPSLSWLSASFPISITLSVLLNALEYRRSSQILDSAESKMQVVSLVEGIEVGGGTGRWGRRERRRRRRRRSREVRSLNKLPSVYLIYGAIRGARRRLKLNFSSCEAS